jgi:hypothetical protein
MAVAAIGMGLMAASQLYQGRTEQNALNADAGVDIENARRAELDGELAAEDSRRRERALSGDAIAALGANGVAIGSGSALDLLHQNAVEREYEILNRRYAAGGEAASLRISAGQKRKAAKSALFGGLLRAGATALTGIGEMRNAREERDANARTRAAQLPGGQQLPIPRALVADNRPRTRPGTLLPAPKAVPYSVYTGP